METEQENEQLKKKISHFKTVVKPLFDIATEYIENELK
jgi:hypothetical protein